MVSISIMFLLLTEILWGFYGIDIFLPLVPRKFATLLLSKTTIDRFVVL